jgi:hypothetical protein
MRDDQPSKRLLENNDSTMEFLFTLKPNYKAGIKMRVDVYEAMKKEVVDLIKQEEGVLLQSFFEILHTRFVGLLGAETGWYLYHVKLDLETRSLIKVERSKGRRNVRTVIKMATRKEKSRLTFYS